MYHAQSIPAILFLIFGGTAVLATIALYTRQSLLVAYMLLGAILGPWGIGAIKDSVLIKQVGDIGIIFLLFLLGINLQPRGLFQSLQKTSWLTAASSIIFLTVGFAISYLFGLSWKESLMIGITMTFSSTIIGLKLLPTSMLHHRHIGELMVSILLLQDLIAITVLLIIQSTANSVFSIAEFITIAIAFPILLLIAYFLQRYVINKLFDKFNVIHEYIFILAIGWCLGMSELAYTIGLSHEIGAFIAGIVLASNPITMYVAESLKPVRDFFLVIFFFTMGAEFNFDYFPEVIWPALALAAAMLILKPWTFSLLLRNGGEPSKISNEVGVRLGQVSEFSLLVIYLALITNLIRPEVFYIVQATTILTFIVSCYWIVMRYPTPLATTAELRRD